MKPSCLIAALLLAAPAAQSVAQTIPLAVVVSESLEGGAQRILMTFSRPVTYEIEETKVRYTLRLREPLERSSLRDKSLEGELVRRVRLEGSSRGAEITLVLREENPEITLLEHTDPFRLEITVRSRTASQAEAQAVPQDTGEEPVPPTSQPDPQEQPAAPLPDRLPPSRPGEVRNIVLDPGHGGAEAGATSSSGLLEKDVVLQIARKLRETLSDGGFRVLMTRDEDRGVDLMTRTAIANHAGADLFLSIHANASGSTGARGAETYYLSSGAPDGAAGALAGQENGPAPQPPGGRPSDDIQLVLWEMAQSAHLARASRLAEMIQGELNSLSGIQDRGVRQAPFRVLVGATMPSVLLEVGFLSNPEEARSLGQPSYQDQIATAVTAAVKRFAESVQREDQAALGDWTPAEAGRQ